MQAVVGVDIGGTLTKLGLLDQNGNILVQSVFPTQASNGSMPYVEALIFQIEQLVGQKNIELAGIGLGAPTANYYSGTISGAANLGWPESLNLRHELLSHFTVPVVITNDANLAAIGENTHGHAKAMSNFISITIGTGLGCGVFVDGKLLHGLNDQAGELGHSSASRGDRYCRCGKRGCLEAYVSARGLVRTFYTQMAKYDQYTNLMAIPFTSLSAKQISEEANKGDQIAKKSLLFTGRLLGEKLADLVHLYNCEGIFISGGVSNSGDLFIQAVQEAMEGKLYHTYRNKITIKRSALPENEISLLGAGTMIWEHLTHSLETVSSI